MIEVNLDLARRLERAEGLANAAFVDSRARLQPAIGAGWIEVAGVHAMFDGPASPITQTFGLGLFEPFLEPQFDAVESFFRSHGAPTHHEVSSFVPEETARLLPARGYAPIEESVVLARPTTPFDTNGSPDIAVDEIRESEAGLWARISALGWATESAELGAFVEDLGLVLSRARGVHCFLARIEGQPIAAAALNLSNGVAILAGATTIPAARRRGAQRALLGTRLAFAAARGIDLAMVVTQPQSGSMRNAEREGFFPVYTRAKWRLE